jgi:hypothetical protein
LGISVTENPAILAQSHCWSDHTVGLFMMSILTKD